MEEFFNQSKGFLGILQSIMSQEERERSAEAADAMFEQIRQVTADKKLNVREMANAALAVQVELLEIIMQQTEEMKG